MALLSGPKRTKVWREMMSEGRVPPDVLKTDVLAAVVAADIWIDGNWLASSGGSYNNALPQPFKGAATRKQKAYLMAKLAFERSGEEP